MPMNTLPFTLPAAYKLLAGQQAATSDFDTGGYDVLIGGYGFRLATDTQFPYLRSTEPTTNRRLDTGAEPGEQTLSTLPWVKSQTSFHAGAGQTNLEAPFTAFQYQQEQIAHLRFDTCIGVDVWTPGKVSRLPDTTFSSFGFDIKAMATATVGGIDYAVVGGVGSLVNIAWLSGPDAAPTVQTMDLTSATFGGASNCSVKSLTTDGTNYYGVLQLTSAGSTAGIMTYIISGSMSSAAAPIALYEVPNFKSAIPRTNLCTNPSFEAGTTSWTVQGLAAPALTTNTAPTPPANGGTNVAQLTWGTGSGVQFNGIRYTLATVAGQVYTLSAKVYVPTGSPAMAWEVGGIGLGSASGTLNAWTTIAYTFTATGASTVITIYANQAQTAGQLGYVDEVLMEQSGNVGTYFDGDTPADSNYTYGWAGTAEASQSAATPVTSASNALGVCGWVKERLIAAVSNSVYELPVNVTSHSALPVAKYTHPISTFGWQAIGESPVSIIISGTSGMQSTLIKFSLDTSGGTPTLSGGATIATLPIGEQVLCLQSYLGTYLGIGTNKGIRVGTFDTYTGNLTFGPLSVTTTAPVYALTGRDRFVYGSFSNQQADGKTGLVRVDLTQPIDAAGRLAWAPDLRPPTSAPTGLGTVYGAAVLPLSGRIVFATTEGFHVEGPSAGSNGTAWLRTSRIRYNTEEPKLFKTGRIHGTLDQGTITVTGITPYGITANLGTFGYIQNTDPGEFGLPTGLNAWIQLQFQLNASGVVLNSYTAKAYPAPARQRVITVTVNCFRQEVDRFGLETVDPLLPRDRYNAVKALEAKGNEIRFVEFTNTGAVATLVVIDQIEYHSFSRPNIDDDFGGYITFKLRETVGS